MKNNSTETSENLNLLVDRNYHTYATMHCSRFSSCSAPLCPLDKLWRFREYKRDERICLYQAELEKEDGEQKIRWVLGNKVAQRIANVTPKMKVASTPFKKRLEKAANTASRITIKPKTENNAYYSHGGAA